MPQKDEPIVREVEIGGVEKLSGHMLANTALLHLNSLADIKWDERECGQYGHAQMQKVLLEIVG